MRWTEINEFIKGHCSVVTSFCELLAVLVSIALIGDFVIISSYVTLLSRFLRRFEGEFPFIEGNVIRALIILFVKFKYSLVGSLISNIHITQILLSF